MKSPAQPQVFSCSAWLDLGLNLAEALLGIAWGHQTQYTNNNVNGISCPALTVLTESEGDVSQAWSVHAHRCEERSDQK